jgi:hypothetical protein
MTQPKKPAHEVEKKDDWYYEPWFVIAALLCFGPLGLVSVWMNPRLKLRYKIFITLLVIAATFWLLILSVKLYRWFMIYYQELADIIRSS